MCPCQACLHPLSAVFDGLHDVARGGVWPHGRPAEPRDGEMTGLAGSRRQFDESGWIGTRQKAIYQALSIAPPLRVTAFDPT